jgi:curved DNA-binding protein CbpA
MSKLPYQYPSEEISPYLILGVSEKDSLAQINVTYKKLLKVLHPDKQLTPEAIRLGWTVDEKNIAFLKIKDAYKQIVEDKKYTDNISNYPDVNLEYEITSDFIVNNKYENPRNVHQHHATAPTAPSYAQQSTHHSTHHSTQQYDQEYTQIYAHPSAPPQEYLDPDNFNPNAFNDYFDKELKTNEMNGFNDPYSAGYNSFGYDETEHARIRNGGSRSDISVTKNPKLAVPEMHNGSIVVKDPYRAAEEMVLSGRAIGNPLGCYELGATNITDFSTLCKTRSGKDSIMCSDLMAVYGENNENWEDSVARDRTLHEKFNDQTRPEQKMNKYKGERASFDHKAIDDKVQRQIDLEKEMMKQQELIRATQLQKSDMYYAKTSRIAYQPR